MSDLEWNLTTTKAVALKFVEWLETEGVRWENFVDATGHNNDRAWQAAESAGWVESIKTTARFGDHYSSAPKVTAAGREHVEKIETLRRSKVDRAAACRQGLVLWIYNNQPAGTDLFVQEGPYQFYGTPFTAEEVRDAVAYLREKSLITGTGAWGGVLLRPRLTPEGTDIVEKHNGDLRAAGEALKPGGDTYYQQNIHGTVNGPVAQGHNFQQVQNRGVDPEEIVSIFARMREALTGIEDPELRGDAEEQVANIELAVSDGDDAAVKKYAGQFTRFVRMLGSQAAITVVTSETTQLLQLLGLS